MDANGRSPRQLKGIEEGVLFRAPTWSFDGQKLAFYSTEPVEEVQRMAIFVMNANGTDFRQLTDFGSKFGSPAWLPGDERLVIDDYNTGLLHVINTDGSNLISLGILGGQPSWKNDSPSSTLVESRSWGQTKQSVLTQ